MASLVEPRITSLLRELVETAGRVIHRLSTPLHRHIHSPRQHTRSPGPARGLYLGVLHPVMDRLAWQKGLAGVF
jgi:hypothetical protein